MRISHKNQDYLILSAFTDHVVTLGTCISIRADVLGIRVDWPAEGGNNDICEAPPAGHQRNKPLLVAREKFEEDSGV
jgi:hypothetical protein